MKNRINQLRNGITVTAFARKCGISQQLMKTYCDGMSEPSAKNIVAICKACGCDSDWLLGLDDDGVGHDVEPHENNNSKQQMLTKFSDVIGRIKTLLNGRTTIEFAKSLGMSPQTVDYYLREQRKPSVEFVAAVCRTCGVSADWLLGLPPPTIVAPGAPSQTAAAGANVNQRLLELKANAESTLESITALLNSIAKLQESTGK